MEELLCSLNKQIQDGFLLGSSVRLPWSKNKKFENILFVGMGGSAISGDIVRVLMDQFSDVSWGVSRSQVLPEWVNSKTLVVFSSYSGNTYEVKEAYKDAMKRKAQCLIVSSGGWMTQQAKKNKHPLIVLPPGFLPRTAVGYLSFSLIGFLLNAGWLKLDAKDLCEVLEVTESFPREEARELAKIFKNRSLRFYGAGMMRIAALRWKMQFAENAKTLTGYGPLPESFHHEVEAWQYPQAEVKRFSGVFLNDSVEPTWITKKKKVAIREIKKRGGDAIEITPTARGVLGRLFQVIMLGDWVSYELSLLYGVDCMKTPVLDRVKASEKKDVRKIKKATRKATPRKLAKNSK